MNAAQHLTDQRRGEDYLTVCPSLHENAHRDANAIVMRGNGQRTSRAIGRAESGTAGCRKEFLVASVDWQQRTFSIVTEDGSEEATGWVGGPFGIRELPLQWRSIWTVTHLAVNRHPTLTSARA